jgi:DNA-binding LacI/PurR family transcriptional regulator
MDDVAREASVSRALVSLVFQDSPKVAVATRARVIAAAERLNYRPNAMARNLASQRANIVGVVVHDLHNPFFAEIVDGLEAVADEVGVHLLLGHGRGWPRETAVLDALLEYRPAGVVLLSPDRPDRSLMKQLNGTPAVVIGRTVRRDGIDSVVTDDTCGTRLAIEHLVALGHRRIVHVSGARVEAGALQRVRAYRRCMDEFGLTEFAQVVGASFAEEEGYRAVEKLLALPDLPTAVFAGNDLIAIGLMSGLADHGIRVPDDLSIVAFDHSALARLRPIALTSVAQPLSDLGTTALRLLLERLRGERRQARSVRLQPSMADGATTGRPRHRAAGSPAAQPGSHATVAAISSPRPHGDARPGDDRSPNREEST